MVCPESGSTIEHTQCPKCSTLEVAVIQCLSCGGSFCEKCPGIHIPPEPRVFESKIHFLYRPWSSTSKTWNEDVVRFSDELPAIVCPSCYDDECTKAILRLKSKAKNWKTEIVRGNELKVLEEIFPTCGVKKEEPEMVKSAKDFLLELNKNKK